jgi:hypothetical protein
MFVQRSIKNSWPIFYLSKNPAPRINTRENFCVKVGFINGPLTRKNNLTPNQEN